MSEGKKKLEKWEKSNWFLFNNSDFSSKFRYTYHLSSKNLIDLALKYGKISVHKNEFSIRDFALSFDKIIKIEKEKTIFIIIYYLDGSVYRLFVHSELSPVKQTENVFSILTDKMNEFAKEKYANIIEFIKKLSSLYNEISIDDLISRTGLVRTDLIKTLENLVLDGEIKAEISSTALLFRKELKVTSAPLNSSSETEEEEKLVFVSYATKDAELYKIPELAKKLEEFKGIGKVLYWQEDMNDSIIEYMNDNLGKCNGVLLFCSPNALNSVPVKKEWMAAEALKKPIIPIFFKPEHIPPLLSDRLGIEFDNFDFQKNVRGIHDLFLKKTRS
ncbi:MAG: toll/interleukin-1 receptor domain-containing protein [Candidatus Thorarchaeota archaeon]